MKPEKWTYPPECFLEGYENRGSKNFAKTFFSAGILTPPEIYGVAKKGEMSEIEGLPQKTSHK